MTDLSFPHQNLPSLLIYLNFKIFGFSNSAAFFSKHCFEIFPSLPLLEHDKLKSVRIPATSLLVFLIAKAKFYFYI